MGIDEAEFIINRSDEIGTNENVSNANRKYPRILAGSPVHQKPDILKEFLECLSCLKCDRISLDFFFYDDNTDMISKRLLEDFAKAFPNTVIRNALLQQEYLCDETTHHWGEGLIWKVAGFKDEMIRYALENGYDALFLVDSDILLEPSAVETLAASGKDIVSEVFWTRWYPGAPELPNVWFYDHYDMVPRNRGEALSDEERAARQQKFLEMLKVPGIYEVGMLGACTLLSRKAMEAGLSFKPISNVSIWGEDRHFCIRSAALGFSMYADTHCRTLHIYREKDLNSVESFKKEARLEPTLHLETASGSSCPICGSQSIRGFHVYDGFKLLECRDCGLKFRSGESPDVASLIRQTYGPSWIQMRDQYLKDTFLGHARFNNMLLELFRPGKGKLLEIGCGTGEFLYMAREAGWAVTGYEPGADACNYAREKFGLELRCEVWDGLPEIDESSSDPVACTTENNSLYDAISFWHVLEHIADPHVFLLRVSSSLKPDGLIFFSLPNDASLFSEVHGASSPLYSEADHLMHYNRRNLSILLEKSGLETLLLFTRQEPQGVEELAGLLSGGAGIAFEKVMGLSAKLQAESRGYELVCIARRGRTAESAVQGENEPFINGKQPEASPKVRPFHTAKP